MCGIIGAVSYRNVISLLITGLNKLEYRGYDSAGLIVVDAKEHFHLARKVGKVNNLELLIREKKITGHIGIAHTRWATHGKPSLKNTHPHVVNNEIALVHNGIIENQQILRKIVLAKGCKLKSETDSEIIAHLIYLFIQSGQDFMTAVKSTIQKLQGAFSLGIILRREPQHLIAVRYSSPLVIGVGDQENFIASDPVALYPMTQRIIYLEEGDIADVNSTEVVIYNKNGSRVKRKIHFTGKKQNLASKGKFSHYMLKEIFEQPQAIAATLEGRLSKDHVLNEIFGINARKIFEKIENIQIVACGSSYHAGLIGKNWLETIAQIPCQTEIASEYRFNPHFVAPNTLFMTLSQSGETADTIAALRLAKKLGYLATLTICNTAESTLVRESDLALITNAGIEIGVASTKAFITQLTALLLLSLSLNHEKGFKPDSQLIKQLFKLPKKLEEVLNLNSSIKKVAKKIVNKKHVLFIGRGMELAVAMEGALKFKEITYTHAEAYPAGEFKHGPIALLDKNTEVIALVPTNPLLKKMKSNLHEILAREAKVTVFADAKANIEKNNKISLITMPPIVPVLAPIIYTIPLQLLAFHVALLKGNDVDQPRNLAKSVTVE